MKIGEVLLILVCALLASMTVKSCQQHDDKSKALNECVEEVSDKCSQSIQYAIALENENARLNKVLKACRDNKGR